MYTHRWRHAHICRHTSNAGNMHTHTDIALPQIWVCVFSYSPRVVCTGKYAHKFQPLLFTLMHILSQTSVVLYVNWDTSKYTYTFIYTLIYKEGKFIFSLKHGQIMGQICMWKSPLHWQMDMYCYPLGQIIIIVIGNTHERSRYVLGTIPSTFLNAPTLQIRTLGLCCG
jgi:hypothetical protein